MADDDEMLEGFLCSICKTDLKTPYQLTKHFEEFHNDNPEILKTLKGETKSYTKYFTDIRNIKLERYSTETNKLLIRLDKLLNELPSDPISRRAHEQSIVPWIIDKSVRLCPTCAKSFHLARRKHHCRLCGAVMCHDCTMFLRLGDARKMIGPTVIRDDSATYPTTFESPIADRLVCGGIGGPLDQVRSPLSGSLNRVLSVVDPLDGEQHFKLCINCKEILMSREQATERKFSKPIICQFYEKMRSYINEANEHSVMYNKMCKSLRKGETTYNLQDTQVLRIRIAKLAENIDLISKRISVLGINDIDNHPRGQALKLQQMIRLAATRFVKEHFLNAEPLPTAEEYASFKEKLQREIEANIQYERQAEIEEVQREISKQQEKRDTANSNEAIISNNDQLIFDQSQGWGPSNSAPMLTSFMDPLIEQMNNLRAYIKQARDAHKYDEVATLEANLRELQSAYFATKQSNTNDR